MNTDNETTAIIGRETMSQLVNGHTPRSKGLRVLIGAMFFSLGMLATSVALAAPAKPVDTKHSVSGEGKDGLIKVATCTDGKSYYAPTNEHRGACSGHGGVAEWSDGSEVKSHGRKTQYR